jgi:basic membrane lipoprotein Med (substrate-binding protein (PBP1-ABC) superfamily)
MTGEQVRSALEFALEKSMTALEVSGVVISYDPRRPPGARILELAVEGVPLDPGATYLVVTNSFLATGGDGHVLFNEGANRVDTGISLLETSEKMLAQASPLEYVMEERWVRVTDQIERPRMGVGLALALAEPETAGLNEEASSAIEAFRARTGIPCEIEKPFSDTERADTLRLLARKGDTTIVVAMGPGYTDAIATVAAEFPELLFVHLDHPPDRAVPGVHWAILARQEAGFILGAAASWLSGGSDTALLVGDRGFEAAEIERGFAAGWRHADPVGARAPPAARAIGEGRGGYADKGGAERLAAEAVAAGARLVVHYAGDGAAAIEGAAGAAGAKTLAFTTRADRVLGALLTAAAAGELQRDRASKWGIASEAFEFEFPEGTAETRPRIEAVLADIRSGKIQVE